MSNSLKKITSEYFEDILVRLAHHSAGIEGIFSVNIFYLIIQLK
ncbi:hypothetical protein ACNNM0_09200 [Aerococcus viridans]